MAKARMQKAQNIFKQACSRDGFTIIELMVAMGLFAIVVSIGVGSFTNALRSERQAAALIEANSNVSLSIEQMMREIRTGYDFCQGTETACAWQGSELSFHNARGETVRYCVAADAIRRIAKDKGLGSVECDQNSDPITAAGVIVKSLRFSVQGAGPADGKKAIITMSLGVSPADQDLRNNVINIQTSVDPRTPDI